MRSKRIHILEEFQQPNIVNNVPYANILKLKLSQNIGQICKTSLYILFLLEKVLVT